MVYPALETASCPDFEHGVLHWRELKADPVSVSPLQAVSEQTYDARRSYLWTGQEVSSPKA